MLTKTKEYHRFTVGDTNYTSVIILVTGHFVPLFKTTQKRLKLLHISTYVIQQIIFKINVINK